MKTSKQCILCSWNKSETHWGRHMVKVHGWRYINGMPPPVPLSEWWRAQTYEYK